MAGGSNYAPRRGRLRSFTQAASLSPASALQSLSRPARQLARVSGPALRHSVTTAAVRLTLLSRTTSPAVGCAQEVALLTEPIQLVGFASNVLAIAAVSANEGTGGGACSLHGALMPRSAGMNGQQVEPHCCNRTSPLHALT